MEQIVRQINIASGRNKSDLVLKNASIINVFTNEVQIADVAIHGEYIVGIGIYEGENEVDLTGKYICPGLLDGHIHLESSMVSPLEFEKAVLPHGTTAVITDPHEIANVAGTEGIDYMLAMAEQMKLDVYFMMPSCVPATPLDEAGAVLNASDMIPYYNNSSVLGLAEVMNSYGVTAASEDVVEKLYHARDNEKVIDGHAPALSEKMLNAYVCAGVRSDHECADIDEAVEKISLGQWVMIREGTAAKNLKELVSLCSEKYYQRCMFVTDDKHPGDLMTKGHIDYIIREAVSMGADPIRAIKMGSWNTAQYFGLKDRGAIAPGYRADIAVFDSLEDFNILEVYKDGVKVEFDNREQDAAAFDAINAKYPRVMDSFQMDEITEENLQVKACGEQERVIQLIPKQLLTKELIIPKLQEEGMPEGVSLAQDIVKAAVFERHNRTGHVGIGFIKGYGIKKGAIASSVAHDSHNLIVVGTNDRDIAAAANCVRRNKGGLAIVVDGIVTGELPLPIAGLMSNLSLEEVEEKLESLKKQAEELGICEGIDPFMTLAFVSLPVIPEVRLNSYGVIDVDKQQVVDVFFDE